MKYTYFIYDSVSHSIKIGVSTNVKARLKELQTGNPLRLRLLGRIQGNVETELHRKYQQLRLTGEWFKCDGVLVNWLLSNEDVIGCDVDKLRKLSAGERYRHAEAIDPKKIVKNLKPYEILCRKAWDLTGVDADDVAYELINFYGPEVDGEDWELWEDSVYCICNGSRVKTVGVNDDQQLLYVVTHPINTAEARRWVSESLAAVAFNLDCFSWTMLITAPDMQGTRPEVVDAYDIYLDVIGGNDGQLDSNARTKQPEPDPQGS